jgi:hypothetical protein
MMPVLAGLLLTSTAIAILEPDLGAQLIYVKSLWL